MADAGGRKGATLLVADEDVHCRQALRGQLMAQGYRVIGVATIGRLDAVLRMVPVDLLLLDEQMTADHMTCSRLVGPGGPPVILFSESCSEANRIAALERGADRCLPKGCGVQELVANLRSVLRRQMRARQEVYRFDGFTMDIATRQVLDTEGASVVLSAGEFDVLRVFVERARRVLTREEILLAARGRDSESFERAVDIQVSRIRSKFGQVEVIRTVRNGGYMFVPRVFLAAPGETPPWIP